MEIKPVKQIEKPKYPLKTELKEEELKKRVPKRWMQTPAAKIALGTLAVVTLAGCIPEVLAGVAEAVTPPTEASVSTTPNYVPEGTAEPAMINVAPLFIHGEGRGSCGCMMVAPPVFLSEDEALVVINEAAKEYGIEFSANGSPEFTNVPQPATNIYSSEDQELSDKTMTFKTDFADSEHSILIEFVSVEDVKKWHQETEYACSVESYNTKNTADQLSDSLERAAYFGYTTGVLYDPCEYSDNSKPGSVEQLKAQAKDFFEWLKDRGVI